MPRPRKKRLINSGRPFSKTTRIDQPDPEAAWKAHDQQLRTKADWLNAEQLDRLHYVAPGTDLVVGLPKHHIWKGAGAYNPRGEEFMAKHATSRMSRRRISAALMVQPPPLNR